MIIGIDKTKRRKISVMENRSTMRQQRIRGKKGRKNESLCENCTFKQWTDCSDIVDEMNWKD